MHVFLRKICQIWKFKQKCEIFHFWAGEEWKGGGDMNTKCQYLSSHPCREYQIRSETISLIFINIYQCREYQIRSETLSSFSCHCNHLLETADKIVYPVQMFVLSISIAAGKNPNAGQINSCNMYCWYLKFKWTNQQIIL